MTTFEDCSAYTTDHLLSKADSSRERNDTIVGFLGLPKIWKETEKISIVRANRMPIGQGPVVARKSGSGNGFCFSLRIPFRNRTAQCMWALARANNLLFQ